MRRLTDFHHVALSVPDLDTSVAWYRRVLGLEVLFTEEGDDRRAVVMGFADGARALGLAEHRGESEPFDPRRTGLDHVAFSVGTHDEMLEWEAWLTAQSVEHSGAVEIEPGAILNFKDPDRIALAFYWQRT